MKEVGVEYSIAIFKIINLHDYKKRDNEELRKRSRNSKPEKLVKKNICSLFDAKLLFLSKHFAYSSHCISYPMMYILHIIGIPLYINS